MKEILIRFKDFSKEEKLENLNILKLKYGKKCLPYIKVISEKDPLPEIREAAEKIYSDLVSEAPQVLDIDVNTDVEKEEKTDQFLKKIPSLKKRKQIEPDEIKSPLKEPSLKESPGKKTKIKKNEKNNYDFYLRGISIFLSAHKKIFLSVLLFWLLWNPVITGYRYFKTLIFKSYSSVTEKIKKKLTSGPQVHDNTIPVSTGTDSSSKDRSSKEYITEKETNHTNNDKIKNKKAINEKVEKEISGLLVTAQGMIMAGKTNEAIEYLENYLSRAKISDSPLMLDVYFLLYDCLNISYSGSLNDKRSLLISKILSDCPETAHYSDRLYFKALDCINNSKDYYSAIVLLEKSILCNSINYKAVNCLAQLYTFGNNKEKALALYRILKDSNIEISGIDNIIEDLKKDQ